MYRIAIVEDDAPVSDKFKTWLKLRWPTAKVEQFADLESAATALKSREFDLVISDIDLGKPGDKYGGVRIAGFLQSKETPVLIVSGLPEPEMHREIFMALDAWDYLQKPVSESDFLNQTRRALEWKTEKRSTAPPSDPDLKLDPLQRTRVTWKEKRVTLSMTKMRLVSVLTENLNRDVGYEKLFDVIDSGTNKENLRVHVQSIRAAFREVDPDFNRIKNVPMVGYTWRI